MEPGAVEVRRSARRRRTMTAFREGDRIVVLAPQRMTPAQERDLVPGLVKRLLDRESKRRTPASDVDLLARAHELAARYLDPQVPNPVRAKSVRWVGNQSTRWGSCTLATGEIRISDRLAEVPAWVTDYVLLHELTHLVEGNHTPRFWGLVGAYPMSERARGFLDGYAHARQTGTAPQTPSDATDDPDW